MIRYKTEKDIEGIRESGKILASILGELKIEAQEGVSLSDLDQKTKELLKKSGAESAFLGYKPEWSGKKYPASLCLSVNEQIVHGIPSNYRLKNADILKIDLGVKYKGYITDAALTVTIGKSTPKVAALLTATERALEAGIEECYPGKRLGDIGYAIEQVVIKEGFSVIKNLTGHGVGFELHEEPTVWNYGEKKQGLILKEGLVLAIEPMVSMGSPEIKGGPNESIVTEDGSISAHFEKTIAITENGPEILTPY